MNRHHTFMGLDNFFHNRKAEAAATRGTITGFIGFVKSDGFDLIQKALLTTQMADFWG